MSLKTIKTILSWEKINKKTRYYVPWYIIISTGVKVWYTLNNCPRGILRRSFTPTWSFGNFVETINHFSLFFRFYAVNSIQLSTLELYIWVHFWIRPIRGEVTWWGVQKSMSHVKRHNRSLKILSPMIRFCPLVIYISKGQMELKTTDYSESYNSNYLFRNPVNFVVTKRSLGLRASYTAQTNSAQKQTPCTMPLHAVFDENFYFQIY